jgi:hypothetical protein
MDQDLKIHRPIHHFSKSEPLNLRKVNKYQFRRSRPAGQGIPVIMGPCVTPDTTRSVP